MISDIFIDVFLKNFHFKELSPDQPVQFWQVKGGAWYSGFRGTRRHLLSTTVGELREKFPNFPQWGPEECSKDAPLFFIYELDSNEKVAQSTMLSPNLFDRWFKDSEFAFLPTVNTDETLRIILSQFEYKVLSPEQPTEIWLTQTCKNGLSFPSVRKMLIRKKLSEFVSEYPCFPQSGPKSCNAANPFVLTKAEGSEFSLELMSKIEFENKYRGNQVIE